MKHGEGLRFFAGALLLASGALLLAMGIKNGEMVTVMQKAIRICMECVGIG
jgi:hypothetical protein